MEAEHDAWGVEADAVAEGRVDLAAAVRALRRRSDLSQRQLAARSGVPPATVGSVECGESANPGFHTVERLVAATGARLAIVDIDGSEPVRLRTDGPRDAAHRQLPAHLDPHWVEWRGTRRLDRFGYIRNRRYRDALRRERSGDGREGLNLAASIGTAAWAASWWRRWATMPCY